MCEYHSEQKRCTLTSPEYYIQRATIAHTFYNKKKYNIYYK